MPSLPFPDWVPALLIAPFVGSFISVLITRLPVGAKVVLARSSCPSCDHALGVRDLVPVLRIRTGEAAIAFSLYPTTIEQLLNVADAGLMMPPKSTWFEPKLRSGLFVHALD